MNWNPPTLDPPTGPRIFLKPTCQESGPHQVLTFDRTRIKSYIQLSQFKNNTFFFFLGYIHLLISFPAQAMVDPQSLLTAV